MYDSKDDLFQEARRAWKAVTPQESLPEARKAALFNEIRRESEAAYVPLLVRGWRWAFVGSLPVLAIASVLIFAGNQSTPTSLAQLSVSKVDGQVVFTLANGREDYVVRSAADPRSLGASDAEPLHNNTFTVDANEGPALVFYRID